ncbi:MAG: 50S ribosomal protein L40e [Candidatus Aenigmarchaeota archaeon]|nr:50S ribosomal protein L40e [Candidatus Aenigmarchaeota archaeon]
MGKKINEACANRLFLNMFVCMACNAKMRTTPDRVKRGSIKCRKCGSKNLRLKAKERRGLKA